jgi:predicted esterase
MSNRTYYALEKQLIKFYEEKAYRRVLDLVEQEQANSLTLTPYFLYWRICMTNLLGKQEEALQLFREAVEQGSWFTPDWLGQDEDLESLHSSPEFQDLLAICRQRLAEAQIIARPGLYITQPDQHILPSPLCIVLHGNMSNAEDTLEEWRASTERGWLLAVPQSSQLVGETAFVWNDRERGMSEVRAHFAAVSEQYKLNPQRIALGGFSKGGGLAIWMALYQLIPVTGFVVLGPYLSPEELEALSVLFTQKTPDVRGTIIIGEEDKGSLSASHLVVELMHAHGLTCELEIIPGLAHEYPADFSERMARGLEFIAQR